jgi:hypothetical protein
MNLASILILIEDNPLNHRAVRKMDYLEGVEYISDLKLWFHQYILLE